MRERSKNQNKKDNFSLKKQIKKENKKDVSRS